MSDPTEIDYLEESPDDWAVTVAQEWRSVEEDERTLRLWGVCPTCKHSSETVIDEIEASMGVDPTNVPIIVICECRYDHPRRPEGQLGCGRSGSFTVDLTH